MVIKIKILRNILIMAIVIVDLTKLTRHCQEGKPNQCMDSLRQNLFFSRFCIWCFWDLEIGGHACDKSMFFHFWSFPQTGCWYKMTCKCKGQKPIINVVYTVKLYTANGKCFNRKILYVNISSKSNYNHNM